MRSTLARAQISLFILSLCIAILWSIPLHAQSRQLVQVKKYGVEDGLSHREVKSICQDERGLMWFGTAYGLNRFDGYSFKWFTAEKNGLSSNDIEKIHLDQQGKIWLFSHIANKRVIDLFDPWSDSVRTFEEYFKNEQPFQCQEIISYTGAKDGRLAFLLRDKIVVYQSDFSEIPLHGWSVKSNARIFCGNNCFWIIKDDSVQGGRMLLRVNPDGRVRQVQLFKHSTYLDLYDLTDAGNVRLSNFYYDWPDEKIYQDFLEVSNEGMLSVDTAAERMFSGKKIRLVYDKNFIKKIQKNYWVNSEGMGFWIIPEEKKFQPILLSDRYPEFELARCIFEDKQGTVWVGTSFGVYSVRLKRPQFDNFFAKGNSATGFKVRGLQVTGKEQNKKLWAIREDKGELWKAEFAPRTEERFLDAGDTRWALDKSSNGNLLFVTEEGISELNPLTEEIVKTYPHRFIDIATFTWKIHRDKYGKLWFDRGNDGTLFYDNFGELNELTNWSGYSGLTFLYQFIEDNTDTAWLVSDKGLARLDIKEGKIIERFWRNGTGRHYLPYDNVQHIWIGPDYFWLATASSGLVKWHPQKGVLERYTRADGLSSNNIYAVYPDDFGNLWLASDYGINRLNLETGQVRVFTTDDGICNNEFNRIAHCRDNDGYLYFGTLDGVAAFHPRDFISDTMAYQPPLVLTECLQFDGNEGKMLDKTAQLLQTGVITLKPNDPLISLSFSLLSYEQTENIQYAYKIEGLDQDWIYQKDHTLRLGRLPYGTHTLHIKGQAANGQWSKEELKIKILSLKPFYLQNWFIASMLMFLILSLVFIVRRREKSLLQQRANLERTVRARTATIEQQKEELKSLDKFKSRFFASVSHELRTPLTMIVGPLESLLSNKSGRSNNERYMLKLMRENSRKLLRMINDILNLSKLESGKMELKESPVNLQHYLNPIMAQFGSFAESNGIHFEVDNRVPQEMLLLLDPDKVETILYNYLSNAMKYTPKGGQVKVSVSEEEEYIRFEVSDSGEGIHEKDVRHIFDRYYQSEHSHSSPKGGSGIGLSLVSQLADLMEGRVGVKSSLGEGSTFFFCLPKKISTKEPVIPNVEQDLDVVPSKAEPALRRTKKKGIKTILIVEDNEALRNYLERIIGEFYNIVTAENGQLAFEYLQKSLEADAAGKLLPDLILSDLMMPVMDGSRLLANVKSEEQLSHIPFIMLTARVDSGARLDALRVGVDDYLSKPFKEEELLARIRNLIKNYEKRQLVEKQSKGKQNAKDKISIKTSAEDREWLAAFEQFVRQNLASDLLSISELARKFTMSESTLLRQLKRLTGLTPKQYIQEVRLDLARQLLESGQCKTVSEVAQKVGYAHTASFTRGFKDRFGVNPSEMLPT